MSTEAKNIKTIPRNGREKARMFSLFRKRDNDLEIAVWRHFASNVFIHSDSARGYKEIFSFLKETVGTPCVYLYLCEGESKKLVLATADFADLKDWAEANDLDDRTEAELREPEIVFQSREEFREIAIVEMLGANLLNIPLVLNEDKYLGSILTGPIKDNRKVERQSHFLSVFSVAAANGVNRFREIERLREEVDRLQSKMKVSKRMLGSALELNRFVDLLLDLAITATRAEAGFVAMIKKEEQKLEINAHKNLPEGFLDKINLTAEDGLFEWSPDDGDVMILRDYDFVAEFQIKSILAVPLIENKNLLGIFALINFTSNEMFSDFSLSILTNFTEQIKLVLNNSRLFEDFTSRYFSTLVAMSNAYDHRSPETTGHSQRVSNIAEEIANQMNLDKSLVKKIKQAALIHDVGMCGVVDIGEDFQADFNHPEIAASMIEVLPIPDELTQAVRTHHEWYDGWGFPNGLKSEQIPISGRILALAEYFTEATTNARFKEALTPEEIKTELDLRRGKQFDPEVVDALLSILDSKESQKPDALFEKCWKFKGEPSEVCSQCPAYKSHTFCWLHPEVNCASHGDELCDQCFLFKEWNDRLEKLIEKNKIEVKTMEHKVEKQENFTLLKLSGEIDVSVAPKLRKILRELIEGGQETLVIDLTEVPFIDSSGLGIFVVAFKLANAKNGSIKFVGARPEVMKVIQLTRLDKHFQLFESMEDAEKSFE